MEQDVKTDGYPTKVGYYYVKTFYSDSFTEDKYLWNGEDFVLGIGRIFTPEVVAWKK